MSAMTPEETWDFLMAGTRTAKVATVRADGRPHVKPVWFELAGQPGGVGGGGADLADMCSGLLCCARVAEQDRSASTAAGFCVQGVGRSRPAGPIAGLAQGAAATVGRC
jgi:hypothetical protein